VRTLGPTVRAANLAVAKLPPKEADPYYATREWKALREACLRRDGYRCVLCGAPAVVADHRVTRRAGGRDELANLRSLCRRCDNAARELPGRSRSSPPGEGV
jgi:5-methylcytosine-specific restriction endonuclease McrA